MRFNRNNTRHRLAATLKPLWCAALGLSLLGSTLLSTVATAASHTTNKTGSDVNIRVDAGVSLLKLKVIEDFSAAPPEYGDAEWSPLIALAVNKQTSAHSTFGAKIEIQRVDGSLLTSFRAIDYRYLLNDEWQLGAYIGASRYNFRSPAYGYNVGFGAFYKPSNWGPWSAGAEVQFMDKLARDKIHPDDVPASQETGPDTFTNMAGVAFTVSYHF